MVPSHRRRRDLIVIVAARAALTACLLGASVPVVAAAGPNTVEQWDLIAENTVVGSGALQNEGLIYMAYATAAMYDAVVAIEGGYRPYGSAIATPIGASTDAAVIQAAYEVLSNCFPAQAVSLNASYASSMAGVPSGQSRTDGMAVGHTAAADIIAMRAGDGRLTPIGVTSPFTTLAPGPGVWRLTPPTFAAAQTPWVANVRTFIVPSADRFLPPPPPALSSPQWVTEYNEIKAVGQDASTVRTAAQTAVARFWSANVIRQYNRLLRDIIDARSLDLRQSARLAAMVNVIGADAQISVMYAKYHYLFWRPVTAIDPSAVKPAGDGYGPTPGVADGNAATTEQTGWRPLLATPNHPEYPAAHGSITSAIDEVLIDVLGTNRIDIDIHGFDPAGAPGNLSAVRHFDRANDLRAEIVDARVWAGVHYRGSAVAGVNLGRSVAKYDIRNAFQPAP